ncbi:hypothetical protein O9Z70_13120 [Devosia sp. YIM 151766]|uniref:hypothetical protein n=1 Tax=Devosia sp. YIM 151766 TaxID=3017325 RepID=UPI00255CB051|nr:hypothetical protein [Devosia sp. YIM 151766]WIY52394.1 hypothetical protein O9Z70_13120 [Devosia sp. YIM 151766]
MTEDNSEISLFDVADWLWSFRWLMLVCAAIGIVSAFVAWQNSSSTPAPSYEIKLQIFSGGTPVRGPGEIADILVAGLDDPRLELISAPAANPVIFRTGDSQLAGSLRAEIAALTDAMMAEVKTQETELERLLPANENALPLYLETKAFIEGVNSGLVSPIVTTVTASTASERSRLPALFLPVMASGLAFLLIAGAISFAREWKRRREPA